VVNLIELERWYSVEICREIDELKMCGNDLLYLVYGLVSLLLYLDLFHEVLKATHDLMRWGCQAP